jgi:hypothetical protein
MSTRRPQSSAMEIGRAGPVSGVPRLASLWSALPTGNRCRKTARWLARSASRPLWQPMMMMMPRLQRPARPAALPVLFSSRQGVRILELAHRCVVET